MGGMSFKIWAENLKNSKKSRKDIEKLRGFKSNIIQKSSSNCYLFLSDVGGLGDAVMFRGIINPFLKDKTRKVVLVTKEYHLFAYSDLGIDKILLWKDISSIESLEFEKIFCHHVNALTYKTALQLKAEKKYVVNASLKFDNMINVKANLQTKNTIWQIYSNFLNMFGFDYSLVDFKYNKNKDILDKYNLKYKDYICLHIGSASLCKNWGLDNFLKLSEELTNLNIKHIFIAGPFEVQVIKKSKIKDVISDLEFFSLVEILRGAKMVVCHNTSILHISATVDTATVSINSNYDYEIWNPYKDMDNTKHFALTSKSSTNCNKYKILFDFLSLRNKNGCPILKNEIKPIDIIEKIVQYDKKTSI